jgi:hypothetical protein
VLHYQESAMLQRRLGMDALAPTLTNLSYAMALTGQFHHARLLAEEAEGLARRRGRLHMLAATLNVRAFVEAFADNYRDALRYTDRALEVSEQLPDQRLQGLSHLARARAYRYLWGGLNDDEKKREAALFDQAIKEASQAANLLKGSPADRVTALLERGCIYRELARLHHTAGRDEEASAIAQKSRADLERVAVLAGALNLPRLHSLAWTDLGWLSYYLNQPEEIEGSVQQAYQPLPEEYRFPAGGPLPPMADGERIGEACLPYWSALGKAEMLNGYLALDRAIAASGNEHHQEYLQTAVESITRSLAYDALVADAYFDLTRAEEGLHMRLVQDGFSIRTLHRQAKEAAEALGLEQPTRFQQFLERMFGPADLWA